MPLTAVSLFSGCGGFDWGATQAGLKIIWANDIEPHAAFAYKSIFPDVPFHTGDVRNILEFPKADVLIGCYPCTGFSIAARRRWKGRTERDLTKTPGNFLYLEFIRALKQVEPKYFFVENVSGMISAKEGWFFEQQLQGFRDLGFTPLVKALRAQDFGAAQDRRRIFIVGIRNDIYEKFQYQFPTPQFGPATDQPYRTMQDVIGDMDPWPEGEFYNLPFHGHYLTRNRKRNWNQTSFTIVASASHIPLHPSGDPMVYVSKDNWALQGETNRRLSWKECLRLQCLPEHMETDGSLEDKYKVVGNAVPPVFAKAIIDPIVQYEKALDDQLLAKHS